MTLPIVIVFLHDGRGLSLAAAGLALAVAGAAGLVGTIAAGVAADRFGAGRTAIAGLALAGAGTLGVPGGPLARRHGARGGEPPGAGFGDQRGSGCSRSSSARSTTAGARTCSA